MKKKALIICSLLLGILLTGCSFVHLSNENEPKENKSVEQKGEIKQAEKDVKNTENESAAVIEERAREVLSLLKNKDYVKLSGYVQPEKGLRLSPYAYVDVNCDIVLSKDQVKNGLSDNHKYQWGFYDGSGEPIELTIEEYFARFVYDYDFMKVDSVGINRFIGEGNTINNAIEVYPNSSIAEYYFSGTKEYEGMDWKSLRLVFEQKESIWYLVGIIHAQWTI